MPDVGEGLTEAEIVTWHVAPGDTVTVNQVIVRDRDGQGRRRAAVPVRGHGRRAARRARADGRGRGADHRDRDGGGGRPARPVLPPHCRRQARSPRRPTRVRRRPARRSARPARTAGSPRWSGYGPRPGSVARRPRGSPATASAGWPCVPASPGPVAGHRSGAGTGHHARDRDCAVRFRRIEPAANESGRRQRAPTVARPAGQAAGPQAGQGPRRRPARAHRHRRRRRDHPRRTSRPHAPPPAAPAPAATAPAAGAGVRREPIRGVRKATAAAMVSSAFTAPHVTEFLAVDVTATMALRDRLRARAASTPRSSSRRWRSWRRRSASPRGAPPRSTPTGTRRRARSSTTTGCSSGSPRRRRAG